MRFKNPMDPIGGPVMGLHAAWALASFTLATLHTVADAEERIRREIRLTGNKADVESASPVTSPDIAWLRFVERMSAPDAAYLPNGAGAFAPGDSLTFISNAARNSKRHRV